MGEGKVVQPGQEGAWLTCRCSGMRLRERVVKKDCGV